MILRERGVKLVKSIKKNTCLFICYGSLYVIIELIYRQYSHWTMFLLGGLCGVLIGLLNELLPWEMRLYKQVLIGDILVVSLEFITGCVVNIWLGWNVWDYSSLPFNLYGQICLPFALLWMPLVLVTIILDDYLRYWWFGEEKPKYKL